MSSLSSKLAFGILVQSPLLCYCLSLYILLLATHLSCNKDPSTSRYVTELSLDYKEKQNQSCFLAAIALS